MPCAAPPPAVTATIDGADIVNVHDGLQQPLQVLRAQSLRKLEVKMTISEK